MSDFEIVNGVLVKYNGPAKNLVIPEGVKEIGERAFRDAFSSFGFGDYSIKIPEGVTKIHSNAFAYCSRVEKIVLPNSCIEIGDSAFESCHITKITIPDGVAVISEKAFKGCSNLKSIKLPQTLSSINNQAFYGTAVDKISLPKELFNIGDEAFYNTKLEKVSFPKSLKHIGKRAFSSAFFSNLEEISFSEGLESIGEEAFKNCSNVKEIVLPKSMKVLGDRAFAYCYSLYTVTILSEDLEYGEDVFAGSEPKNIKEPATKKPKNNEFTIDESGTLTKYKGLKEEVIVPDNVKIINEGVFLDHSEIKNIQLPEGLIAIKGNYQSGAFNGCTGLTSIEIPESVETIEWYAFYGCSNLVEMTLPYKAISDDMFGSSSKTIIFNVIDDNHTMHRNYAVFRKDYWSQTFVYPKRFIFPLNENDYYYYDRVLASGNYDGFAMNEDGRVRACLWRLAEKKYPISADVLGGIVEFLMSKVTKAIKTAEKDGAPDYITTMVNYGVINDDNRKKVVNALKKSEKAEITAMADNLTPSADFEKNAVGHTDEASKAEDELDIKLRKNKATKLLLKTGIDKIPDVLLADKSGNADNRIIKFIISEYLSDDRMYSRFSKEADKEAKNLDRESLNQALLQIYDSLVNEKQIFAFLNPLFRYADGKTVQRLSQSLAKSAWKQDRVNDALMLNDSREAMLYLDKQGRLDEYAELRGKKADVLRDTVLSEFDLDENGQKTYDLGETVVKAQLMEDLSLQLYDEKTDKVIKSIPKRGVDEEKYAEAAKDYDDLKKNIKKVIKNRSDILFKAFLNKTKFQAKDWKNVYLSNPVLKKIGQLIIWQQDKVSFTISGKQCITVDGKKYKLTTSDIIIAHPMEMKAEDISGWQEYLKEKDFKQPFIQIWEPVYDKKTIAPDRYKGAMIPYYRFLKQEKHGIEVKDYDYHNDIEINLKGCQATIERIDWRRHEIAVDDRFKIVSFGFKTYSRQVNHLVAYFDRVTAFERVKQDDISIMDAVPNFNIEQIMALITTAQKENAVKVLAALLEYKNNNYAEYSTIDSLTLDL